MSEILRIFTIETRELWVPRQIERVPFLSLGSLEFLREYVAPNRPVILSSGICDSWPALQRWHSNAYLIDTVGYHTKVLVNLTPDGRGDFLFQGDFLRPYERKMCFGPVIEALTDNISASSTAACHAYPFQNSSTTVCCDSIEKKILQRAVPYLSLQNDCLRKEYSDTLMSDIGAGFPKEFDDIFGCKSEAINLWIGDSRSQSSLHKDHYENLFVVLRGQKIFTLYPPADIVGMKEIRAPSKEFVWDENSMQFRIKYSDPKSYVPWIDEESLFTEDAMSPLQVVVNEGECLYLPSLWYHRVEQRGFTIGVNSWWDMPFDCKYIYYNLCKNIKSYNLIN